MRIYINGLEYRIANDYEITEQAGATAVMSAQILLEDKRIPQPFDTVEVNNGGMEVGFDDFSGGVRNNVEVSDGSLSLKKDLDGTWNQWYGYTWEDIA